MKRLIAVRSVRSDSPRSLPAAASFASSSRPAALLSRIFALFAFALLATAVASAPCRAQSDASPLQRKYDRAKARYLELARKDPRVDHVVEWERAAAELLTFIDEHKNTKYAPRAMFALARLYEYMFRRREFQTGLSRAVYFYERLAAEHPDDNLADDALLLLGDLKREALQDPTGAEAEYRKLISKYPRGDMIGKARRRLGLPERPAANEPALAEVLPPAEESPIREAVDSPDVDEQGREVYSDDSDQKRPVIVLDPGHGGEEEGAHGVDGSLEKEVVLRISMLLEEYLRERLRARVILTRKEDVHVPLTDRTKLANDYEADIFVSVHANASVYKNAKGIETYYLDNTNDQSSLKLAERENASLLKEPGGGDLGFMLSDLIQNAKLADSISLAHYVQKELHSMLSRYYDDVKDLGVKKAPFYVLVGAHMPCILVEVSFIDHPVEGRRLITPRYQSLIANALYEGIRAYFEKH